MEWRREDRTMLGAYLHDSFGAQGAQSLFVDATAGLDLGDGWRLGALRRAIADLAETGSGACVVPRHRRAFGEALGYLGEAVGAIGGDTRGLTEPELVADSIRRALDGVGAVLGRVTPDDVLGRIFAGFCVGK